MIAIGLTMVTAAVASASGPALAAPGPSKLPSKTVVFDSSGKEVTDPARVAKILASKNKAPNSLAAVGIGQTKDFTYQGVQIHGAYAYQWLDQGAYWTFGNSQLRLQGNDDLQITYLPNGGVWWHTNTAGSGARQMRFQPDGNLVLYTSSMRAVWASDTWGVCGSSRAPDLDYPMLALQSDSNFVIYCTNYFYFDGEEHFVVKWIWATQTVG